MRRELLTTSFTFLAGLAVGSYATEQYISPSNAGTELRAPQTTSADPTGEKTQTPAEAKELNHEVAAAGAVQDTSDDEPTLVELGPMTDSEQIQVLNARWANLDGQVNRLLQRIDTLERRVASAQSVQDDAEAEDDDSETEVLPTDTPERRRVALVSAGVPSADADEIVWRQSQQDIQRLELRDQAVREGWFRSDRYYEELSTLSQDGLNLRTEIGTEAYDRYLFQTGTSNRVRINAVIEGSAADQTGLLPGDIIESYGGERIFDFSDLRDATTEGTRDESVEVIVRRGDSLIETLMARGPIGVSLEGTAVSPES